MLIDDGTDGVSEETIGAGIEVHKKFGPGLLENAYHLPMVWALEKRGLRVETERPLSIEFDGKIVPRAYLIDIVVEGKLIVEIKSIATILPIHLAQVSTYLGLSGIRVGLLMNFNVQVLRHGIKRVLHPDLPRLAAEKRTRG
jgi:GxxExxY protein